MTKCTAVSPRWSNRRASLLLASALLLSACAHAERRAMPVVHTAKSCAKRVHLSVVGDSLARGWGASRPANAFAGLVYGNLRRTRPGATFSNYGIPGATTDEIARKEVPLIERSECSLVIVIAGANDVQKLYTPGRFARSYGELLHRIRDRVPDAAIAVIGLPDVALSPIILPPLKPIESALSRADNRAIATEARGYGATFIPMYEVSHANAYRAKQLLSGDGIHPNDAGYRVMAHAAFRAIGALLR